MKRLTAILRKTTSAIGLLLIVLLAGNALQIFAHGGEDHGDAKPKTQTTDKGTVSHSSRLGDLEVMLKHPVFAPDTATEARLFVTKFETNEAFKDVAPAVEIESATGAVTQAVIEKSETAGVFSVKFPALPEGTYTVRTKLTHDGETDTATFSGVEVKNQPLAEAENGGMSWLRTVLIGFVFLIVLGLFGALSYFVLRFSSTGERINKETVSA
jgi:cobalt-zinc-cadmium efflux system membrane fusion protein